MEITCKCCGQIFVGPRNAVYCKKTECRKYMSRIYARKYNARKYGYEFDECGITVRQCQFCGKSFIPKENGARLKHCSNECYKEERKIRHRECARRNQKSWPSYHRYHEPKTDYAPVACAYCGKEFVRTKGQTKQKYCSRQCMDRAKKGIVEKAITCKTCGKEFKTFINSAYCSDECRNYKEPEQIEIRVCKKCNKVFFAGSKSSQVYCSAECRDTPVMYHHTCEICGNEFDNYQPEQYACSGKCKEIRDRRKLINFRNLNRHHGKVRERFAPEKIIDKGITWQKIISRDGCNCGICGLPVDVEDYSHTKNGAFIAGPNYPSIDHIVPRAKGGEHSWKNVQLAHFYCNTIKCDNMEAII